MTTIEKLARAIAKGAISEWDSAERGWQTVEQCVDDSWRDWLPDAHACLTALLEPTEAMVEAGFYVEGIDWQTDDAGRPTTSLHVWQAMIRAALEGRQ